ncbi:MAG TPA: four-carbon acid sugar kinase family protein [Casimicrobiaceae bacterium]
MSAGFYRPKIAYYGDDFTGATDTLATAARAGLRTLLFFRPPTDAHMAEAGPLDCLGIAGAARSMTPAEMQAKLEPVGNFFARLAAPVMHYKVCSTFDSSPEVGSIGAAVTILRRYAQSPLVAIVGGQPNLGRYCVFGNLFAAAGLGGQVYRIDRHPTMSQHPVTPMREGDLRMHLAHQGLACIPSIDYVEYDAPAALLDEKIDVHLARGANAVLFDVGQQQDLAVIGRALWQRARRETMLIVGPSTVVQALCAHWELSRAPHKARAAAPSVGAASAPVFVFSGSLSAVTARQVAAARSYVTLHLDVHRLVGPDAPYRSEMAARAARSLGSGCNVLAYTSDDAVGGRGAGRAGRTVAIASAKFVSEVVAKAPVRRMGIAGGDTSSHAITALDAWGLSYVAQIAAGVALCRLHSDEASLNGLEVMLKGGQMGPDEVFEHLVHGVPAQADLGIPV